MQVGNFGFWMFNNLRCVSFLLKRESAHGDGILEEVIHVYCNHLARAHTCRDFLVLLMVVMQMKWLIGWLCNETLHFSGACTVHCFTLITMIAC